MSQQILLLDAYAHIFRLFYAMRGFALHEGEPVNAVYGMTRLLLHLEGAFPCSHAAVAFDRGKCQRRIALLPEYKAQRPPTPPELHAQVPRIREVFKLFGWNILLQEGIEADDLIAAVTAVRDGLPVRIFSSDKDLAQLLDDPAVSLMLPAKDHQWEELKAEDVVSKFGVPPSSLNGYLALLGDSSDNITGVEGIGAKTAAKLMREYGSLDELLTRLDQLGNGRWQNHLAEARELLLRNRELIRLDTTLPDGWDGLESLRKQAPDWPALTAFAERLSFRTLLPAIRKQTESQRQPELF